MTKHPKGAELVDALIAAAVQQYRASRHIDEWFRADTDFALAESRNAIIALIDDPVRAAGPDLYSAASRLIAAIDGLQSITTAERIITGRSDASVRKVGNEAVAALRAAIAKAEAPADAGAGLSLRERKLASPYGEWCRNPDLCHGKGYCPRNPTCGD